MSDRLLDNIILSKMKGELHKIELEMDHFQSAKSAAYTKVSELGHEVSKQHQQRLRMLEQIAVTKCEGYPPYYVKVSEQVLGRVDYVELRCKYCWVEERRKSLLHKSLYITKHFWDTTIRHIPPKQRYDSLKHMVDPWKEPKELDPF